MRIVDLTALDQLSGAQKHTALSLIGDGMVAQNEEFGFAIGDRLFHFAASPHENAVAKFANLLTLELAEAHDKLICLPAANAIWQEATREALQYIDSAIEMAITDQDVIEAMNGLRYIVDDAASCSGSAVTIGEDGIAFLALDGSHSTLSYYSFSHLLAIGKNISDVAEIPNDLAPDLLDRSEDRFSEADVLRLLTAYEASLGMSDIFMDDSVTGHQNEIFSLTLACLDRAIARQAFPEDPAATERAARQIILPRK